MIAAVFVLCVGLLAAPASAQRNVLFLIADDVGVDNVAVYGEHPDPARTPVIDQLAADGMLFRRAYGNPTCSPTRATILTGRYAWRTGLGLALSQFASDRLKSSEVTMAEVLAPTHRTAAVGKWHLGPDPAHPIQMGFEHHWGTLNNFGSGVGGDYDDYAKNIDGVTVQSTTYATTDTVDDALTLIDGFGADPWFLWVAFHAAHTPFHKPPANLHTYNLPAQVEGNEPIHSKAMIEAMDTEIGRLLASLDPATRANTLVVFLGDNGPVAQAVTPPWDPTKVKTTIYEGGIRLPFIVSGPGIPPGTEVDGLVNSTDLFSTIAEYLSLETSSNVDSVSLVPYFSDPGQDSLREFAFSESFLPNFGDVFVEREIAAMDEQFKLVQIFGTAAVVPSEEQLYDLAADPFETVNLLEQPLSFAASQAHLDLGLVLQQQGPVILPEPWAFLGGGTLGFTGPPVLLGGGVLKAGSLAGIRLLNAPPNALVLASLSLAPYPLEAYGGGLTATPSAFQMLAFADGTGQLLAGLTWPPGFAPGTGIYFQCLIADPTVPWGITLSNALKGTTE